MPRVDVVVATYNRPVQLARCLEGLARQSFRDFSVMVVDDASETPSEKTISVEHRARLDIRILRTSENRGPGRGRNLGVAQSSAELIAFIDDDVVPDQELLQRQIDAYDTGPTTSIQFGPLKAPLDWEPTPWNRWEARTIEQEYQRMEAGAYEATWRQFFTGNAFVPRTSFLAAGGFNDQFTRAEDIELAYRLALAGCHFRFVPEAIGWHYAERTRQSWLRIAREYARFDVAIDELHPEINWLKVLGKERASRNVLSRIGYAALSRISGERQGVALAVSTAELLHRCRLARAGQPLLSFAYSLEYESALANILQGLPPN